METNRETQERLEQEKELASLYKKAKRLKLIEEDIERKQEDEDRSEESHFKWYIFNYGHMFDS